MESNSKKCYYLPHFKENANYYCKNCNIYMCNKCFEYHTKLFEKQNHITFKTDKDNKEIFTGFCKEDNHFEILEFFCKNHNKLCCSSCICKIKNKKYGTHKDCDVCLINEIKEEKKNKLAENLKILEDISNDIKESINSIKIIYDKMIENKEELKLNVQKVFTKIRNKINNREDELLLEIDQKYEEMYFKEELIKESERLPNKIMIYFEKGNLINKDWDDENKLNLLINDCINIEENIKNINEINNSIKKFNKNEINICFNPTEEKHVDSFCENFNKFGMVYIKQKFLDNSKIISNNKEYINSLQNWINPENKDIKSILLYRLSEHGEEYSKFHELCDNQGSTITLFHVADGNKVGIFTTCSWDSNSNKWKEDEKTFIFNLNQNKKYSNIRRKYSIYCQNDRGPYTDYFGIYSGKTMKFLYYDATNINLTYENGSNILPIDGKSKYYNLIEVEVFKIIFQEN